MSASSGKNLLTITVESPGAARQEAFFVQQGVSIGRNPDETICLDDPQVDRLHAKVRRQPDGAMLLECVGPQAVITLPDGQTTRSVVLESGVAFRIGAATLRCQNANLRGTVDAAGDVWHRRCPNCHADLSGEAREQTRCPVCAAQIFYQPNDGRFEGWLPAQVGPYTVRAFCARGGMGIVLRGLHEKEDLLAAVKLMDGDDDIAARKRFEEEVRLLQAVVHPHLVRLQDHGADNQLRWLAMDWIQGETLAQIIAARNAASQSLPLQTAAAWLRQIVAGLGHLHDKSIVHRDLKPGNILVGKDDLLKVADFGLAKAPGGAAGATTRTGTVAGTLAYLAPELIHGGPATPASDVFSLGVVWYEMLTGHRPTRPYRRVTAERLDVSAAWAEMIGRCLADEPHARPTCREIASALESAAGPRWQAASDGTPPSQTAKPLPARAGKSAPVFRILGLTAIGVALAASLIAIWWAMWMRPRTVEPERKDAPARLAGPDRGRLPTKYLPDRCMIITAVNFAEVYDSDYYKKLRGDFPEIAARDNSYWVENGIDPANVRHLFITVDVAENASLMIVQLRQPLTAANVCAAVKPRAEQHDFAFKEIKVGGQSIYERSWREGAEGTKCHLDHPFAVVEGGLVLLLSDNADTLKAILSRAAPAKLTPELQAAVRAADFSKTVAVAVDVKALLADGELSAVFKRELGEQLGGDFSDLAKKWNYLVGEGWLTGANANFQAVLATQDAETAATAKKLAEAGLVMFRGKLLKVSTAPKFILDLTKTIRFTFNGAEIKAVGTVKVDAIVESIETMYKVTRDRKTAAKAQIDMFERALEHYILDVGSYPGPAGGLQALRVRPSEPDGLGKWNGPYLNGDVPLDPWGYPYQYLAPGNHNPDSFDVWTASPYGEIIGNWK